METLRLIVGLGNPGVRYKLTRHNIGFMAVERLAVLHGGSWKKEGRFESQLAWGELGGFRVLMSQPQTFMNCSGRAIRALMDYYKVPRERMLVVVDDADLQVGQIRMRKNGSSGGHHGLDSVEENVSGRDFPRLKIGIGRQSTGGTREIKGYVLGKFGLDEQELMAKVLDRVVRQIECWITFGASRAMNDFNGMIQQDTPAKQED